MLDIPMPDGSFATALTIRLPASSPGSIEMFAYSRSAQFHRVLCVKMRRLKINDLSLSVLKPYRWILRVVHVPLRPRSPQVRIDFLRVFPKMRSSCTVERLAMGFER